MRKLSHFSMSRMRVFAAVAQDERTGSFQAWYGSYSGLNKREAFCCVSANTTRSGFEISLTIGINNRILSLSCFCLSPKLLPKRLNLTQQPLEPYCCTWFFVSHEPLQIEQSVLSVSSG